MVEKKTEELKEWFQQTLSERPERLMAGVSSPILLAATALDSTVFQSSVTVYQSLGGLNLPAWTDFAVGGLGIGATALAGTLVTTTIFREIRLQLKDRSQRRNL